MVRCGKADTDYSSQHLSDYSLLSDASDENPEMIVDKAYLCR